MHRGSCLCGRVQYKAAEIVGDYVLCHCPSCRKASGAAFGANVSVPLESFSVETGESDISTYESSPNKVRHFCSICGSPLFTKVGVKPEYVRIRLGSLDSEFSRKPSAHIFTGLKADWDEPHEGTPSFEKWPTKGEVSIEGSRQPGT